MHHLQVERRRRVWVPADDALRQKREAGSEACCHNDGVEVVAGTVGEDNSVSVVARDAGAGDEPAVSQRLEEAGVDRWWLVERGVLRGRQAVLGPAADREP